MNERINQSIMLMNKRNKVLMNYGCLISDNNSKFFFSGAWKWEYPPRFCSRCSSLSTSTPVAEHRNYHLYTSQFVWSQIDFSSSEGKGKQLLFCDMSEAKAETHPQAKSTIQPSHHQPISQNTEEKKKEPLTDQLGLCFLITAGEFSSCWQRKRSFTWDFRWAGKEDCLGSGQRR